MLVNKNTMSYCWFSVIESLRADWHARQSISGSCQSSTNQPCINFANRLIGLLAICILFNNAYASSDAEPSAQFTISVSSHASSSRADVINPPPINGPESEFHMARLVFDVNPYESWGPGRPWWRIDWPEAEEHFLNGLERYTLIDHAADSVHVELSDDEVFDYPWLFAQQVGRWNINDATAKRLGEYLRRGGFMLADDIHGPRDWERFAQVMKRALPEYSIEDIRTNDQVINILYDLDHSVQIPGRRHVMSNDGQGNVNVQMPYSPHKWRGIKDSNGRWMVGINFNMDMGDSWEHANDPVYPLEMTSMGYRLGINYLVYAFTH